MNIDLELGVWRDEWQSDAPVPADLRRRVERQSQWMKLMWICQILITVVFGGGTAAWALLAGREDVYILAVLTWLSLALAWSLSVMNTRGLWSAAESHADFLDLSIRRCSAQIRAAFFSAVLYSFNLTFTLWWVYHAQPIRPVGDFLTSWRVCVVWAVTAVFFGWLVWHRRRKRAERNRLLKMRKAPELSVLN